MTFKFFISSCLFLVVSTITIANPALPETGATIPLQYSPFKGLRVDGRLFGRKMCFLLDTGVNVNIVRMQHTNGVASPMLFDTASTNLVTFYNRAMFVIGKNAVMCRLLFHDLENVPLDGVDAIVGPLFFTNFITAFNFEKMQIVFYGKKSLSVRTLAGSPKTSAVVPFDNADNVIVVPVKIQDVMYRLLIDTGMLNGEIILFRNQKTMGSGLFESIRKQSDSRGGYFDFMANRFRISYNTIEDAVFIGEMQLSQTGLTITEEVKEDIHCDGIIGLKTLLRMNMVYDFDERLVLFRRHDADIKHLLVYGIGLSIRKTTGGAAILSVKKGSEAENAGIAVGDVITEIDGNDIAGLDFFSISRILYAQKGRQITLVIGGKRFLLKACY